MIKRLLHLLPFVHFYSKWAVSIRKLHDGGSLMFQTRRCTVCGHALEEAL